MFEILAENRLKQINAEPKKHARKCFVPHEDRTWYCNGQFAKDGSLYTKCCECVWCDVQTKTRPENIQKGLYYH